MLYDNVKRTACGDNLNGILQPACHNLATLRANLLSFIFNIFIFFSFFFRPQNRIHKCCECAECVSPLVAVCMRGDQASSIDFISLLIRAYEKSKTRIKKNHKNIGLYGTVIAAWRITHFVFKSIISTHRPRICERMHGKEKNAPCLEATFVNLISQRNSSSIYKEKKNCHSR